MLCAHRGQFYVVVEYIRQQMFCFYVHIVHIVHIYINHCLAHVKYITTFNSTKVVNKKKVN